MSNVDLVSELKSIKAEILAMKQSHSYGLNAPDFYYYDKDFHFEQTDQFVDLRLTIEYDMEEEEQPFQIYLLGYEQVYGEVWDSANKKFVIAFSTYLYETGNYTILLATTKPVKSLEVELV